MATIIPVKNAFNGGELSPQMRARSDLPIYQHAVARMLNWWPLTTGGMRKRPGSRFVWEFPDSNIEGRLLPFVYERTRCFALLLQPYTAYVFVDGAVVLTTACSFDSSLVEATASLLWTDYNDPRDPGLPFHDGAGPFRISTTGTLPTGLSAVTDYYIRRAPRSYTFTSADVTNNGGIQITLPAHGLMPETGWFTFVCDPTGRENTTTALTPTGLTPGVQYYIADCPDANHVRISATKGGGPIAYTDSGTGNFKMELNDNLNFLLRCCYLALTPTGPPVSFVTQGTGIHTLTPQTDQPLQIRHPYDADQIQQLSHSQIGDLMWLGEGKERVQKLARHGDSEWLTSHAPYSDGPYLGSQEYEPGDQTHESTTINPANQGPGTNINFVASNAMWHTRDVGRLIRICGDGNDVLKYGWGTIRQIVDAQNARVDLHTKATNAAAGARKNWNLASWSQYLGWPALVALHHQRVWFANNGTLRTHLWATQAGSTYVFAPDEEWNVSNDYPEKDMQHIVTDASGITYAVMIDQVNGFQWLCPMESLLVGAAGGLLRLAASELEETLTPDNPRIQRISKRGVAQVTPVQLDDAAIFAAQDGKSVMATVWDPDRQKMRPHDLQRLVRHLASHAISGLAATPTPLSSFWVNRSDGSLHVAALDTRESVLAWATTALGAGTAGDIEVESCIGLEGVDEGNDELWMVVRRTIDGATKRTIERLSTTEDPDPDVRYGVFIDSAICSYGVPTATITLPHLPNETVRVLADGKRHADVTLNASGVGALDDTYTDVCAGLPYSAIADLLPVELPPQLGYRLSQKTRRIVAARLRLVHTLGLSVGPDADHVAPLPTFFPGDTMDAPLDLFSGVVEIRPENQFGPDTALSIVSDGPHPAEVSELSCLLEVGTW